MNNGDIKMSLIVPASDLAAALKGAAAIVQTKTTLPLLAMVRLVAENDTLEIVTTNLDIEYRQTLSANVAAPLSCCVDAARLTAMAGTASGDMVMTLNGNILTIKAGRSRWAAPAIPVADFPTMPVAKLSPAMKCANLPTILSRTLWAASAEIHKAMLYGVFLNNDDGKARWVSTDGIKLASVVSGAKWPKGAPDVIVPAMMAKAMSGASGDGTATLEWDDAKLRFVCGSVTITGKMIDGSFPDYRRLMADGECEPCTTDAGDLIDAVRRVRIASDAMQRKLRVNRQDGSLSIWIEGTSGFEGEEEIAADCSEGFETCINADILIEMLRAMDADTISIEQSGASAKMYLRPVVQPDGMEFIGLIQPIRI